MPLLPTDNDIYSGSYSLNELKQTVVENRNKTQQQYQTWQTDLWDRLEQLFVLIDQGSQGQDIPKEDLYIPAYNGGLFRTNPDDQDSQEAVFLSNHEVGDTYIAEVIELLTRHDASEGEGKVFVDYSSLDERNLGSIYEGLLEYKLDVADEPLTVDDGEYSPAGEDDDITVEEGDVYLRTDDGERKATGSYYTPEYVVEYIVDETLGPLINEISEDMLAESARGDERGFAEEFADRVFDLTVLDPAMGSGHFPVNAVDYLAREIINAQEQQDRQALDSGEDEVRAPTTEDGELRDINWARRKVAQRCIYGVDVNPLATELAKVSLWLRTLAAEQPLAFLDHHLKTGNSLVGSDIEDVLSDGDDTKTEDGQLTLQQSFDHTRQRAMEHVTDRFQDLLNIDNETLEDAKEMEAVYDDVRDDPLYNKLLAMANVHTADEFGLDVPNDADERMARALHSESWEKIEEQGWFRNAQAMAEKERFFHWELEFPIVFYDQNGARKIDSGFDAVIGNPPYVRIQRIHESLKNYLFDEYQTCESKTDLSLPFIEKSINLLGQSGYGAYISTSQWLSTDYGRPARKYLSNGHVRKVLDFNTLPVFQGISTYPSIFEMTPDEVDTLEYGEITNESQLNSDGIGEVEYRKITYSQLTEDSWVFDKLDLRATIEKVSTVELGELGHFHIGAITGGDDVFVVSEEQIEEKGLEPELIYPYAHHNNEIHRFANVKPDDLLIYPYKEAAGDSELISESVLENEYPNIHKHLSNHREKLEQRKDSRKYYAKGKDWFRFLRPGRFDYITAKKLLFRGLAKRTHIGWLEQETVFSGNNCPGFISGDCSYSDEYLICLLNSTLISAYLVQISPAKMQDYSRFNAGDLNDTPIRLVDFDMERIEPKTQELFERYRDNISNRPIQSGWNEIKKTVQNTPSRLSHDLLSLVAPEMTDLVEKRNSLNLSLLDYLGNYTEGPDLPDIGRFQPTESNILNNTTEDYEKLQIERARTKRDGPSVTIESTARYKPGDEDEFKTDTYGYTETEFFEAFTLTDLSEEEAALVEAFVPVAVDKEIANFSDNATKNISLLDRLKAMQLPDPDAVAEDLRRYVENRERADELDTQIEKTDDLIDEIVYDLYDLTDEEIAIVEEAVADD